MRFARAHNGQWTSVVSVAKMTLSESGGRKVLVLWTKHVQLSLGGLCPRTQSYHGAVSLSR